jgi:hypothetical protein
MSRAALGLAVVLAAAGCGGDTMGRVSGTVTYQGRPVTQGIVQFIPASGPMAAGGLDAQGRFRLTTRTPGDGALAGHHTVCVIPFYPAASDMPDGAPPPDPKDIPKRYRAAATTTLAADVVAGRLNEVTFELTE